MGKMNFLFGGCCWSGDQNNPAKIVKKDTITETKITSSKDKNNNRNIGTMPYTGIDTFNVRLQMNGIKDRKIIPLNIISGEGLFAVVHKENKKNNICINQIEMPDSTFDRPFGDSLYYKIKMGGGLYKIIIGPDLMAIGKLNGVFKFKALTK